MLNKKIPTSVGILIIVLLAGGLIGVTFFFCDVDEGVLITELEEVTVYEKIEKPEKDEFKDWETYRNEEYGFEFEYPFQVVDIVKNIDGKQISKLSPEPLFSLSFKFNEESYQLDDDRLAEEFSLNIFDVSQKNQWETYATGYAIFIYDSLKDKWIADGISCDFSPDSTEHPPREKFIHDNDELEDSIVLELLRDCAEFYSFAVESDKVYHFQTSSVAGFRKVFVILDSREEYVAEFSYNFLYDELASKRQEEDRLDAFEKSSETFRKIIPTFRFIERKQ